MHGQQGRSSGIGKCGQPRKHSGGWELTVKHICLTTASYSQWSVVKEEGSFVNDGTVAQHLLALYERLGSDVK